jgi:hypothetical protein
MRVRLLNPRALGLPGSLLLVAVAPASPSHAATWSAPATLSSPATFVDSPFIGFGTSGEGLASWSYTIGIGPGSSFGLRAAPRAATGQFGAERELPADIARHTVYARDRVVAVSQRDHGDRRTLRVAFGSTSGRIAAARTIDRFTSVPGYGNWPELAANDRGDVAVAYLQRIRGGRRAVTLADRRPGGRFAAPRIVAGRGRGAFAVTVALGARGDLVVAWQRRRWVEARVRRAGGRLGPVQRLGPAVAQDTRLHAAVAPSGAVWVAWDAQLTTEGGTSGPFTIRVAMRPAGARTFRPARVLERNEGRASAESRVDLALDPAGAAFVAWSSSDGASARARLATFTADGQTAIIRTLSQPGYDASVRDVATSQQPGEALVVWARLDAVGELGTQVLAGPIAADGTYAGEEAVSDADRARLPATAFDPVTGAPTVVWSQRIGPDGPGVPVAQVRTVLRAATRSLTTR